MKPPFPWFGGKGHVVAEVWRGLGDVDHYVEPFAGSLAVLLNRPAWHRGYVETVNDLDQFIANFWRAVAAEPEAVAAAADWPVNETDLTARHLWLVNEGRERLARLGLEADPAAYDAQVAGWWVWGLCCWIGAGWCAGDGPWTRELLAGTDGTGDAGRGVNRGLPHLGSAGRGVNRKRPHLGSAGQGVNRQLPHLRGVKRQRPHLGIAGQGVHARGDLIAYMAALSDRLRRVRVCCGDWARVVTDGALACGGSVGVLLDPPYDVEIRTRDLYREDAAGVAAAACAWALAHGDDPRFRIVLCGYEGEHEMPASWRVVAVKDKRAYGTSNDDTANAANRLKARLWLSPSCLRAAVQPTLFAEVEA